MWKKLKKFFLVDANRPVRDVIFCDYASTSFPGLDQPRMRLKLETCFMLKPETCFNVILRQNPEIPTTMT